MRIKVTLSFHYSMWSQNNSTTYGSWHSFLVPLFSSQNAFSRSCYLDQNKIKVTSFDISNYNAHALAFLGTPWNSFLLPFFCFAIWGQPSTDIFSWPSYTIACSLHAMLTWVFCCFSEKGDECPHVICEKPESYRKLYTCGRMGSIYHGAELTIGRE